MAGQAQVKVTGHVVNERGETVEYVSIEIEEDSVGVISDAQGHFTLTIPAIAVGTGTWGIAAVIPKYLSLRLPSTCPCDYNPSGLARCTRENSLLQSI